MKKIIFILLIILLIPIIIAVCPPDCTKEELEKNPAIINTLTSEQLVSSISRDIKVLEYPKVLEVFEERIKKDISLINDNFQIKEKWFSNYKISINRDAKIESFDGKAIKTAGKESTKFEIDKYPNAQINKDGGLIIKSGEKISSGELFSNKDGSIDIKINKDGSFQNENGKFSSLNENQVSIKITEKGTTIEGNFKLTEVSFNDKISYEISGKITTDIADSGRFILGEKTKVTEYLGSEKFSFETQKELSYVFSKDISNSMGSKTKNIDGSKISTIYQDSLGNLKVFSNQNNKIDIEFSNEGEGIIKNFKAQVITDNSEINLKYSDKNSIQFVKDNFNVIGDISTFSKIGISYEVTSKSPITGGTIIATQEITPLQADRNIGKSYSSDGSNVYNEALVARKLMTSISDEEKAKYPVLLIEESEYLDPSLNLNGPKQDALAMKKFLVENGFSEENIQILNSPTKDQVIQSITQIKTQNPNSGILFYDSGHGVISMNDQDQFYIATSDINTQKVSENSMKVISGGLSSSELASILPKSSIVIADTCHSGCLIRNNDLTSGNIIITSSGTETSQTTSSSETKTSGLFTTTITESLQSQSIPNIDKALEEIDETLSENLKPNNWKTAKSSQGLTTTQKPQISGLAIANTNEKEDTIFVINIESKFGNLNPNLFIYQKE